MDDKLKANWPAGQACDDFRSRPRVVSGMPAGGMSAGEVPFNGLPADGRLANETPVRDAGLDRRDAVLTFVEMNGSPMVVTDPNQRDNPVVLANRPFLDLTGYQASEIVGRNCRCLQGADTDSDAAHLLKEAVDTRCPAAVEILNYKRDGTPFWNHVHVSPLYDHKGRLLYFCASQLDVTHRRDAEQACRQTEKIETLGLLTAGLAHNFNNLLHVMTGSLELLKGKLGDLRLNRYIDDAASAAERGAKITTQLLAFGRRARLVPKAIDLGSFVNGRRTLLQEAVGQDIRLRLNASRALPLTLIDPVYLEMALLNLLDNARAAMPHGGTVAVTASLKRAAGPGAGWPDTLGGEYVAISISDEGDGMSAEVRERASEPFFTTKPAGTGSGLGLSMVHGFVRQSRGRLEIDSDLGYGTTVRIIFPTIGYLEQAQGASMVVPMRNKDV